MNSNDLKLISQLMRQARSSWAELGGLIGLSAPAAAERVRKLEEAGVIDTSPSDEDLKKYQKTYQI